MTTVSQRPASGTVPEPPALDDGGGHPWAIVAQREIVVRLTNRAFLVSTLITLLFIAGFGAFSVWQSNSTTTYTVAVTGADGRQLVERAAAVGAPGRRQGLHRGDARDRASRRPARSSTTGRPTPGCTRPGRAGR